MVMNCPAERSFFQLKHIKNLNRTTMRQEKFDSLSLLMIESDLLHNINFDGIILDFARYKSGKKNFDMYMYIFSYL